MIRTYWPHSIRAANLTVTVERCSASSASPASDADGDVDGILVEAATAALLCALPSTCASPSLGRDLLVCRINQSEVSAVE